VICICTEYENEKRRIINITREHGCFMHTRGQILPPRHTHISSGSCHYIYASMPLKCSHIMRYHGRACLLRRRSDLCTHQWRILYDKASTVVFCFHRRYPHKVTFSTVTWRHCGECKSSSAILNPNIRTKWAARLEPLLLYPRRTSRR
jgi:hypothetical protein